MRSLPELLFGVTNMDFYKIILAIMFSVSLGIVLFLSRLENSAISGRRALIHKPTGLSIRAVTVETITMLEVAYSWLNPADLAHLTTFEFLYVSGLLFVAWRQRLTTYGIAANADNNNNTTTPITPPTPERRLPRRHRKKLTPRSIINRLEARGEYHPSDNAKANANASDNTNAHASAHTSAHDNSPNHNPASGPSTTRFRRGSTVMAMSSGGAGAGSGVPVIGNRDYRLLHAMDEQVREQVTRAAAHATAVAHDADCECCAVEDAYEV